MAPLRNDRCFQWSSDVTFTVTKPTHINPLCMAPLQKRCLWSTPNGVLMAHTPVFCQVWDYSKAVLPMQNTKGRIRTPAQWSEHRQLKPEIWVRFPVTTALFLPECNCEWIAVEILGNRSMVLYSLLAFACSLMLAVVNHSNSKQSRKMLGNMRWYLHSKEHGAPYFGCAQGCAYYQGK